MADPAPSPEAPDPAAQICARCGQVHVTRTGAPACTGHVQHCSACGWSSRNRLGQPCVECGGEVVERPCRDFPVRGAKVCDDHGAGAPQVRRRARRTVAKARLEGEVAAIRAELGTAVDGLDEAGVLREAVHRARVEAKVYELAVGGLGLVPGTDAAGKGALVGADHLGDLRTHPLVAQYERWNAEAGRLAKMAIDAGVARDRLELEEATLQQVTVAMRGFARALLDLVVTGLGAADAAVDVVALVRRIVAEAEPEAYRQALAPLAALEVEAHEVTRDDA